VEGGGGRSWGRCSASSRAAQRPVHIAGIDRRRDDARAVGAKRLEHQRDELPRRGWCRLAGRLDDPGIRHQQKGQVFGRTLLMVFAAVLHLRRDGEGVNAVPNLILGALAAFVAYGRLVLAPYV
jgi:hypothetical protein